MIIIKSISFLWSSFNPYCHDLLFQQKNIDSYSKRSQSSSTSNSGGQPVPPDKNVPGITPVSTVLKGKNTDMIFIFTICSF